MYYYFKREHQYSPLSDGNSDASSLEKLFSSENLKDYSLVSRIRDRLNRYGFISCPVAIILFVLVVALWREDQHQQYSYESGFRTDLVATGLSIDLEVIPFTGAVKWNETKKEWYRVIEPGQTQYVGEPSPELDEAWINLLSGTFIDLSANEAPELVGMTHQFPETGKYMSSIGVYHALHCVDQIRRMLSPDYYNNTWVAKGSAMHRDHCLDYIRQQIQCHGDLTPLNVISLSGFEPFFVAEPRSDTVHTCRKFSQARSWSESHPSYYDEMDKHIVQDTNGILYDTNKVNVSELDVEILVRLKPDTIANHHHIVG